MAKNVNILDRAPDALIRGLNWILAPLEDPVGLDRPLWRDISRHQGAVSFDIMAAGGVHGVAMRQGISWGYQDPRFDQYWYESDGKIQYRTSYHVLYPNQPVEWQWEENWKVYHPQLAGGFPRIIDLELHTGMPASVIANQTWEMSERVADHDGVRPIIYSRYMLVNEWLSPYWTEAQLNDHYWILAQYLRDRIREHPGPPTLPDGVDESRVILHQTADKKAGFPGEAESASVDWDRWELGNEEEMHAWIAAEFGGIEPPEPSDFDCDCETINLRLGVLESAVDSLADDIADIYDILDGDEEPDEPNTIAVRARQKFPLGIAVDHDLACSGQQPSGKPIIEHPPMEDRIIIQENQIIEVYATFAYSCKDSPGTPTIRGAGGVLYYVAVEGYEVEVSFIRKDLVEIV